MVRDDAGGLRLVGRVGVGVEEEDGHGFDAGLQQAVGRRAHLGGVERPQHAAIGADALRHLEPEIAGDERRRHLDGEVVERVFALAPDLERVAEARGGDGAGAGALAFDQGVGEQRGGVHDAGDGRRGQVGGFEQGGDPGDHALAGVGVGGQDLQRLALAGGVVVNDEVGEGAADVDAERCRHLRRQQRGGRGGRFPGRGRCRARRSRRWLYAWTGGYSTVRGCRALAVVPGRIGGAARPRSRPWLVIQLTFDCIHNSRYRHHCEDDSHGKTDPVPRVRLRGIDAGRAGACAGKVHLGADHGDEDAAPRCGDQRAMVFQGREQLRRGRGRAGGRRCVAGRRALAGQGDRRCDGREAADCRDDPGRTPWRGCSPTSST